MTVHKGLGITIKSNNKGKGNCKPSKSTQDHTVVISISSHVQLCEEWKSVEFLLIDKVSLVSLQLLAEIDHALHFTKKKPDLWFGSVAVIFAGDFFQYPPMGGSTLYVPISAYSGQSNEEIWKRLRQLAWKSINVVAEQQHMKGDVQYGNAVCQL
ncbi:hypothetical protein BDR06DRAFT_966245 [Suillus hirtellus]|nr:hypothetical protein BDR06DRAFT_966245 [Suillus hirtellus]